MDDDFYALEEDIQNMKLEHEAMQSQYQKIRVNLRQIQWKMKFGLFVESNTRSQDEKREK